MPEAERRPYLQRGIEWLEQHFKDNGSNEGVMRALERELGFRSSDRARRLRRQIQAALSAMPATSPKANSKRPKATSPYPGWNPIAEDEPPIQDISDFPSFLKPQGRNEPSAILAAWIALEALSPQTYRRPEDLAAGDRRCVAELSSGALPWSIGERSRPNRQLYYQVVIGAIPMASATEDLVKAFGDDEERNQRTNEKAAIAAVLVNREGIVLDENAIAVSSFAWALPLALELRLGALGAWPRIEPKIIKSLDGILRRIDPDGQPLPLDTATIGRAFQWLVAQFRLPPHLVELPTFAIRVFHYYKSKQLPEVMLLNSFFIGDLVRVSNLVAVNSAPRGIRRYLGIENPAETHDLLSSQNALEAAVAPRRIPAARWPAPGGHPLVLLQQAAVNVAVASRASNECIVAVNGPPGTGKTTLLRDVVASCVLDRASAMAAFEEPEKAFTPSGQRMAAGDNAFLHLYRLDPSLKGHEVLVASSNNKAVENISRELPGAKAIGRRTDELNYFKSISDLVQNPHQSADEGTDGNEDTEEESIETWGLIAAVLGNARNRAAFNKLFWWHEDRGFRIYLKAAKGDSVVREITDPETGQVIRRETPSVVLMEQPPAGPSIKGNWQKARRKFRSLKKEIESELAALEGVRQQCIKLAEQRIETAKREVELATLVARLPPLEAENQWHFAAVERARQEVYRAAANVQQQQARSPSFFARLLGTRRWKEWSAEFSSAQKSKKASETALLTVEQTHRTAKAAADQLAAKVRDARNSLQQVKEGVAGLVHSIEAHRRRLGGRLIDDQFFARGHEPCNLATAWIPEALQRKREDLFIAAMEVHRAFIDASAQKVLHNLGALMNVFFSSIKDEAKRVLLGDLWSTLFLVVPVVSTTFASVDRMLGDLPPESFGCLLIDEAGQALPQAAVGAIARAKNSIVVGDPLQIPPVVTLPDRLTARVCDFFCIEKSIWAAPDASAQTVADRTSRFQAEYRSNQGPRRVGLPLLVHRRCQEPMFGISNRIAYDGQMVQAVASRTKRGLGSVLGPSRWLDIDGDADSKWCPSEGEVVVDMLKTLAAAGVTDPDLFIISPFRIVAQELRRRLARETQLHSIFNVDSERWVEKRIGTIHTVQGREADLVILVLGAPKASQHGARSWACSTPNILNVAVSRAKESLYVVGSRGSWSGVGHARVLAESLPTEFIQRTL